MQRRDFLKRSGLTLAGTALLHGNGFGRFAFPLTGDDVLANAREGISKYRMTDVELKVVDLAGKPVAGLPVDIIQRSHAFLFGDNNVAMDQLFRKYNGPGEKLFQYRKLYADVLNALNCTCYWTERPRNNMAKTEEFQGRIELAGFEDSVNWANANGLTAKGHPLFWPVPKAIPGWLRPYPYETQLKFLEVRLRDLVSRFKGRVKMWDAVNEMLWEPALKNLAQRNWPYLETKENMAEYISFVLRICREEDPDAVYLLNDYGLEIPRDKPLVTKNGTRVTPFSQRKRYLELIGALRQTGYPPNGLGLQCHDKGWMKPDDQVTFYDEMSQAGLPVHITEFWAHTDHLQRSGNRLKGADGDFTSETFKNDNVPQYSQQEIDEMQARYVADYMTVAFGHPAVKSFFFWGFMDMAIEWKPGDSPAYEKKPVYNRVRDLIHKEWNSSQKRTTNSDGRLKFRGFYGDYSLRYFTEGDSSGKAGIPFSVDKENMTGLVLKILV